VDIFGCRLRLGTCPALNLQTNYEVNEGPVALTNFGFRRRQKFYAAVGRPLVQPFWLRKFAPVLLSGLQRNTHLVELHYCGIRTDGFTWPLGSNSDQVLLWFILASYFFVVMSIVLEKGPDSLA
jgi:hypothetical protein